MIEAFLAMSINERCLHFSCLGNNVTDHISMHVG